MNSRIKENSGEINRGIWSIEKLNFNTISVLIISLFQVYSRIVDSRIQKSFDLLNAKWMILVIFMALFPCILFFGRNLSPFRIVLLPLVTLSFPSLIQTPPRSCLLSLGVSTKGWCFWRRPMAVAIETVVLPSRSRKDWSNDTKIVIFWRYSCRAA